jgi:hypothetical protein
MSAHSTQEMLLTGTHPRGNPWTAFTATPGRPRRTLCANLVSMTTSDGSQQPAPMIALQGGPLHGLPVAAHGFGFLIGVKEGRMVSWAEADVLAHYSDQGVWSHNTPRTRESGG